MRSRTLLIVVVPLAVLGGLLLVARNSLWGPAESISSSGRYFPGQRWAIRGRALDPQPNVVIGRIESSTEGAVFHVSLFGVHIATPRKPPDAVDELPHMPLSAAALDASVVQLLGSGDLAVGFERGYSEWSKARGGVFSVSVADVLDLM